MVKNELGFLGLGNELKKSAVFLHFDTNLGKVKSYLNDY